MIQDTDKHWERWGKEDPYYGVLSSDKFRREVLDDNARQEFFATGDKHIDYILDEITQCFPSPLGRQRGLDFGCGVGRLVIPMAKRFDRVVGVDISDSMLEEAGSNCRRFGVQNVELVKSDATLSRVRGPFDFIHSHIVFQHIPVKRGMAILNRLVDLLGDEGVGAIQFVYGWDAPVVRKLKRWAKETIPFAAPLANLLAGRPLRYPQMQMNQYDYNKIFDLLQKNGCHRTMVRTFESEGEWGTAILIFRKQRIKNPWA